MMKKLSLVLMLLLTGAVSFVSCVKKEFDAPPDLRSYDPMLPVTTTISQLKTMAQLKEITDPNMIIYGIVVADDRSGNFYKQIVIQDSTGGITLLVDANSIYSDLPIGRKIYVKCKGLYLGNYNDLPQLGYTPDETGSITGIPQTVLSDFIVEASFPNVVTPKSVTLAQVATPNLALLNTLITIDNVEFDSTQVYKKYADPAPSSGTSRTIWDCSGHSIILRTSGYSKFQPSLLPAGKGKITAIYTVYKGTPQLVIRDTTDVQFTGTRCNGTVIEPPQPPSFTSLQAVKNMWAGSDVMLNNIVIKAVVISDRSGNNTSSGKLMTIQDGDRGVTVFFSNNHNFAVGDSLHITLSGAILTEYNGVMELTGFSTNAAEKVGAGTVVPKQITLSALNANFEDHESTLIKVVNGTVAGGGTYQGNKILSDGSGGTITLYTSNSAVFKDDLVPTGPKTFTGIVGQFGSTRQLQMRNISDVQ